MSPAVSYFGRVTIGSPGRVPFGTTVQKFCRTSKSDWCIRVTASQSAGACEGDQGERREETQSPIMRLSWCLLDSGTGPGVRLVIESWESVSRATTFDA
jgi:hypothetical protein